jgi:hypothetical protein
LKENIENQHNITFKEKPNNIEDKNNNIKFIDEFFKNIKHFHLKKHFIINRDKELLSIERHNIEEIGNLISSRLENLKKGEIKIVGQKEISIKHLENWLDALNSIQ